MKFIQPSDPARSSGPGRPVYSAKAAAVEKALSRYIPLECGHFCPREIELLYRVFGDGTQVFCENCDKFVNIRKPKPPKPLPQEPIF